MRILIYVGAAGTLMLVMNGAAMALGRMALRGVPAELVIIVPAWGLLGTWVLVPYWGALWLQRFGSATRGERVLVVCAVLVLIALGANSFLATSAFVGGRPHPTADGITILLIPILQWVVLGGAGMLLGIGQVLRRGRKVD